MYVWKRALFPCKYLLISICVKSQWMCLEKCIKVVILSINWNAHLTNQKSSFVQIGIFFKGKKACRVNYRKNRILMPFYINITSVFWIDLAVFFQPQENVPAIPPCLRQTAGSPVQGARACDAQHPLLPWPELGWALLVVRSESTWVCSLTPSVSVMGPSHFTSLGLSFNVRRLDYRSSEVLCCP